MRSGTKPRVAQERYQPAQPSPGLRCPGAPGRQWGGVGVREGWGGGAWAGAWLVRACYAISPGSLPSPGEPPALPVGKAGIWRTRQGGQAVACPPQGNQHFPCLPGPREHNSECLSQGGKEEEKGPERTSLLFLRKRWPKDGRRRVFAYSHSRSWGLRKEAQGLRPRGLQCPQGSGARQDGRVGHRCSLSVSFPVGLSPVPAAHLVLKACCPQTLPSPPSCPDPPC